MAETTFDFDQISTDEPSQPSSLFDHIRDQHAEDAPLWQIHQAYSAEITGRIDRYKSPHFLVRFWFQQTHGVKQVAEADPVMFLDILNHFQAALERLTDIPARESPAAASAA